MVRHPGQLNRLLPIVLAIGLLVACSPSDPAGDKPAADVGVPTSVATDPPAVTAARLCDTGATTVASRVAATDLTETSGVVASRRQPGVLWSHNDSGGDAEVFALGGDGAGLGRVEVTDASAFDWEDIALGPGADGTDQLYPGDIGDNASARPGNGSPVRIYRVPEPDASATATAEAVAFDLTYADGPRDAETLLVDPVSGDVFIVSKQWDGSPAGLYRLPADTATAAAAPVEALTLERVGDLPATAGTLVTGGDVAADGTMVALRTYPAVWLWDRDPEQTLAQTLADPPTCRIPVPEPQGEAVAFTPDGQGFVTISEGENPPVRSRQLP